MTLQRALAMATNDDWPTCLSLLLAVWRKQREPVLAELIEKIGARISVPVVATTSKAIYARSQTASDGDLTAILAAIEAQTRVQPAIATAAIELAEDRDADPRVAALLAKFYERSPLRKHPNGLDTRLADALDKIDDPRFRALFGEAAAQYVPRRNRFPTRKRAQIDHIAKLAAAVAKRRKPPALTAVATSTVKAIAKALTSPAPGKRGQHASSTTELLAAIYANPDDTAARLVYADALQEAGNPRGEHIALQCARTGDKPSRREAELEKAHARAWLGAIEPEIQKQGLVYRRGFPAAAKLSGRGIDHPDDPLWHTFEELDLGHCWNVGAWLPKLRGLRRVTNVTNEDVPELVRHGPFAWTTIGLAYPDTALIVKHTAKFPSLVELDLAAQPADLRTVTPLVGTKLAKQLRRVRLQVSNTAIEAQLAAVRALAPTGLVLELVPDHELVAAATLPSLVIEGDHIAFVHRKKPNSYYESQIVPALRGLLRTASSDLPVDGQLASVLRASGVELVSGS